MRKLITNILAVILLVSLLSCNNNEDFKNGDIILHTSTSTQSKMIQDVTKSKYSHVGIIYIKDGQTYVMEAVQPVKLTPIDEFINRGVDGKYTVVRYKGKFTKDEVKRMYDYAYSQLGKNYDLKFQWSENTMYCSELVFKIYYNAGIQLCDIHHFKDYNLSSEDVQNAIKVRYNTEINPNERVVTPVDLYNSLSTYVIFDNY
jgi:uncharacterized protein YycO